MMELSILLGILLFISVFVNLIQASKLNELNEYYSKLYADLLMKMYAYTDQNSRIARKTDQRIKYLMKKFNLNGD